MQYKTASAAVLLALGLAFAAIFAAMPAYAQTGASGSANAQIAYRTSYPEASASSDGSVTVQTEHRLYRPGETVRVTGTVSEEMRQEAQSDMVTVTLAGAGSAAVEEEATVDSDGRYSVQVSLPGNAEEGDYSAGAKLEVSASVLGLLEADVIARLESSTSFVVAAESSHEVTADTGERFEVEIASNSTVSAVELQQEQKMVRFMVEGEDGTTGTTQVTVPKAMLSGEMLVMIDGEVVATNSEDVIVTSNTSTETTFEISYGHSEHEVAVTGTNVVPEFPASVIAMAAALGGVSALAAFRRRLGL
jgi:hypothetical protein